MYESRKEILEGLSFGNLWKNIHEDSVMGSIVLSFDEEKEIFLWFVQRLLEDGRIKLASHDKYLQGSIEEQLKLLKERFPDNQEEMDNGAFDGFWFLSDKCPCGIVWIHENGYEDWT